MKIFVFIASLFISNCVISQEKVQWSADFDESTQSVIFHADIENGWHLYSQNIDPMAGPIPTEFRFDHNYDFEVLGKTQEPTPLKAFDANFESEVLFFEKKVNFTQNLQIIKETMLHATVTYMICNDVMCLPPVDEKITLKVYPTDH